MIPSIGLIELFNHLLYLEPYNCVQTNDQYQIELFMLDSNAWNHWTVCKQLSSVSFKDISY